MDLDQDSHKLKDISTQTELNTANRKTNTTNKLASDYYGDKYKVKIVKLQNQLKESYFSYESFKNNEKTFKFYTSLTTLQFDVLWKFLGDDALVLNMWRGESRVSPKHSRKEPKTISPQNQLFLTLVRLRVGLVLFDLSNRFGISVSYASRICNTWIMFIYNKFKNLSIFPERETDKSKIPIVFRKYKNIRVVIDGFEVRTQKAQNYGEQGNTYSSYKASPTFKFLCGMHPSGAICYISDAFEGATSDRQLFKDSGFISHLVSGDLVMADRGFNVADICNEAGCSLIIPPFLSGRDKFTKEEVKITREIAAARIHVERVIGRIKEFRILQRVIPKTLVPIISQLVFVTGMLVNFQEPLVV